MSQEKDVYILGIESSCDETAAAVVKNGREVLSNIISSQIVIHRKFGGVVPEIASRKHIENIMPVIDAALREAQVTLEVRESNVAAQKAYLTCGFASEGVRPNYYEDNHENAVIMWLYKNGVGAM